MTNNEVFYVWRDWGNSTLEYTKSFTLTELQSMAEAIDESVSSESFTYFLTGLDNDSYADSICEDLQDTYQSAVSYEDPSEVLESVFAKCMKQEAFLTTWTVFRLWNINLTKEEAMATYKRDCVATLEGMLEE